MCSEAEDYRAWLDPLTPKITAELGQDCNNVRYETTTPSDSYYLSNMFFVNAIVKSNNSDEEHTIGIVVKKPPSFEAVREKTRTDEQFHNEILFYETYGKIYPNIPRCIYAESKPPIDSVIVLENVITQRGYDACQWKYDVPLEYTVAAFQEIARFHAKAYSFKENHREEFFNFVENLREPRYCPQSQIKSTVNGTSTRSIEYLRKQGYETRFCDKLEAQLEDAYENLILKMIEPEEPLATLCHGDFTINNSLFKKENGKIKAMFVDFALITYGSPVLDLSTFLSLHCANDLNKDMLDRVLKVYHDELTKSLTDNGMEHRIYSYETLYEDYKKKGLFGFFIATFFLGVQMEKCTDPLDFISITEKEWGALLRAVGGDEISEILANMLLNLKEIGCLDHLLADQ